MNSTSAREQHEQIIPYNGHNNNPIGTRDRYEEEAYYELMEPSYNPAEEAYMAAHPEHPANQIHKFSSKPF